MTTTGGIPWQFALYCYGPERDEVPFGDGVLCIAPGTPGFFRLSPPQTFDAEGELDRLLDFEAPPLGAGDGTVLPGVTWYFQLWYRDPLGPGGTGLDLTDALGTTFCP